jgi:hypothetical protein
MALKGDRFEGIQDIRHFMNEVAERGGIATMSTAGSGAAMDQSARLVTYAAQPSGKVPVGILMGDMVDKDLTRTHLNQHKNETQKGGKVTLLKEGWVTTNMIYPNQSPAGGDKAYVGNSGLITNVGPNSLNAGRQIGEFETSKDEDGYASVYVKLPNNG